MKDYLLKFYEKIKDYNDYDYLKVMIRFYSAPTLANLKVSSMINLTNTQRDLKDLWIKYREEFKSELKFEYIELKESKNSILILIYNKENLENTLKDSEIRDFLKSFNYLKTNNIYEDLIKLKSRFNKQGICPNEVGIFLGYPLEDVRDFHCCNKECKLTGYWRCYNNEKWARKEFEKYDYQKIKIINEVLNSKRRVG